MKLPDESIFLIMDADKTMQVVRDLRALGLVQGYDFEFKYNQARYDNDGWQTIRPRGTEFYFREGKWITWITLKYAT